MLSPHRTRPAPRAMNALLVPALLLAFALFASAASADNHAGGEAIKLGAGDLGKSREELGARSLPAEEAASAEASAEAEMKARRGKNGKAKKHRGHGKHGKHGKKGKKGKHDCEDCDAKHGECHGDCKHGKHHGKHGRGGYKQCLEKSIRAGNSFDESSRVCRAVFPGKKSMNDESDRES